MQPQCCGQDDVLEVRRIGNPFPNRGLYIAKRLWVRHLAEGAPKWPNEPRLQGEGDKVLNELTAITNPMEQQHFVPTQDSSISGRLGEW